jgi:hypothetical protein
VSTVLNENVIKNTKATLQKVISEGRKQVGTIIGDKESGVEDGLVIYSKGKPASFVIKPDSSEETKYVLKGAVIELYDRDVAPLIK